MTAEDDVRNISAKIVQGSWILKAIWLQISP
jgi:hypothetical protein